MTKYAFLSDEWIAAARAIRADYAVQTAPVSVRMNQIVRDVPFGEGVLHTHLDTSSGRIDLDLGHLDSPDLTISVDYATAKALLVDGDPAVAMQAFMSGRIKVDGDIAKLLGLGGAGLFGSGAPPLPGVAPAEIDPLAGEVARRLQDITE